MVGDAVILGSQAGAYLFALDRKTGTLEWKTQLDAHPAAVVTQSPTVHQGMIYVGVGSLEEPMVGQDPLYPCCTSRGSALAVRVADGSIAPVSAPAATALISASPQSWGLSRWPRPQ